jgi:hypothetical protein
MNEKDMPSNAIWSQTIRGRKNRLAGHMTVEFFTQWGENVDYWLVLSNGGRNF